MKVSNVHTYFKNGKFEIVGRTCKLIGSVFHKHMVKSGLSAYVI
jgi:hypothetical protein